MAQSEPESLAHIKPVLLAQIEPKYSLFVISIEIY